MKINDITLQRIKEAARIEDVVADFMELRKNGVRYTCLCPFHDDNHDGNFIVYPKANCYRCFTCGAKGGTIDFLMQYGQMEFMDAVRYLGKKYGIETDGQSVSFNPPPPRPLPPPLPMLELPMEMVNSHTNTDTDTLCQFIKTIPWDEVQLGRLSSVLAEYHIGHARQGHTIFWQIDEEERVRTGKMMLYKTDGHRDKTSRYNFDWIHSLLFRSASLPQYSDEKQDCQPCLFGLHLLNKYPQAAVNIAESEKTAILMAIAYGNNKNHVWMACGGIENINPSKLAPIMKQNRRIILYPDRDAISKWREKQNALKYDRLSLNVQAVMDWWKPEDGDKADIADVVLRMLTERSNEPPTIEGLCAENPAFKMLKEKINLKTIHE